jgi:membrane fusion protein (multidrug efflux system)
MTLILALAALGCQPPADGAPGQPGAPTAAGQPGAPADPAAPKKPPRAERRVEVVEVRPINFDERVEVTAAVEAIEDATLSARAAGTVESIANRGDVVKKGQIVARLDPSLARAGVAQARAQVSAAQSGVALTRGTLDRQQPLLDQNIISALEFENIRGQSQQATAQLAQARAALAQAQAQVDNTVVVAPFDGRIESRQVEPGEQISPGQPMLRLVDIGKVKVVAGVPERYATDVREGAAIDVAFSAYGLQPRQAQVTFVGSAIDPKNRTFPVEAVVDNPEGQLKPQMIARVQIVRSRHPNALVVPIGAVVRDETGSGLFVVEDTPRGPVARRRQVEIGPRSGEQVQITSGIQPGDRVVTLGQATLTADEPIAIVADEPR